MAWAVVGEKEFLWEERAPVLVVLGLVSSSIFSSQKRTVVSGMDGPSLIVAGDVVCNRNLLNDGELR